MISAEFLFGGNASFEVKNNKGDSYHFNIKLKKGETDVWFARVKKDAEGQYNNCYAGYYKASNGNKLVQGQRGLDQDLKVMKVLKWAVNKVLTEGELPEGYSIEHIGKCGCCGKALTDQLSKDLGLGPVCLKHVKLNDRQEAILKLKALGF